MKNSIQRTIAAGALLATSSFAFAVPIYNYTDDSPNQNSAGGDLSSISTTYNANTGDFSWNYTVEGPSETSPHNGFWLVVNNGPENPKYEDGLTILYGDLVNEVVTAYIYDTTNSPNSWYSSTFLQSFTGSDALNVTGTADGPRDVSVNINVANINNQTLPTFPTPLQNPWNGVSFDEHLGIWFHSTSGSGAVATYNNDGSIASFQSGASGWVDTGGLDTMTVPEPGVLYLSVMGLMAAGVSRKIVKRT